jgi:UDP-2,3-diacylglucosamine hydrolase
MPSAFLPPGFDARRPVALIAGRGNYPLITAAAIRRAGVPLRLIAMDDETSPELVAGVPAAERVSLNVGQIGKMLSTLKDFGAGYALMAGQVKPQKLFHGLTPDLKAASILFSLKRRNAETIFGAIAAEIEKLGITLLDARAFIDDQLADAGSMTGKKFPIEKEYLDHGIQIAREIARLDIGQGCVVRKGTVLAVEAFEGTDDMLRRAGSFKTDEALFVKTVKHGQDYRFDVPVFGLRTLATMREAPKPKPKASPCTDFEPALHSHLLPACTFPGRTHISPHAGCHRSLHQGSHAHRQRLRGVPGQ